MVLAEVNGYPSTVCTVEEYAEVPGFEANRLADARLLASAPVMLKALRTARLEIEEDIKGAMAVLAYEDDEATRDAVDGYQIVLDIIDNAITLATGEQA